MILQRLEYCLSQLFKEKKKINLAKPFSKTVFFIMPYQCRFFPLWDQLLCTVTLYKNTRGPIFFPRKQI